MDCNSFADVLELKLMKCQQATAGASAYSSVTSHFCLSDEGILETLTKKRCSLHPLQSHFARTPLIISALAAFISLSA